MLALFHLFLAAHRQAFAAYFDPGQFQRHYDRDKNSSGGRTVAVGRRVRTGKYDPDPYILSKFDLTTLLSSGFLLGWKTCSDGGQLAVVECGKELRLLWTAPSKSARKINFLADLSDRGAHSGLLVLSQCFGEPSVLWRLTSGQPWSSQQIAILQPAKPGQQVQSACALFAPSAKAVAVGDRAGFVTLYALNLNSLPGDPVQQLEPLARARAHGQQTVTFISSFLEDAEQTSSRWRLISCGRDGHLVEMEASLSRTAEAIEQCSLSLVNSRRAEKHVDWLVRLWASEPQGSVYRSTEPLVGGLHHRDLVLFRPESGQEVSRWPSIIISGETEL